MNKTLLLILGIGLAARLALLPLFAQVGPGPFDALEYSALAVNLVEHGEFALTPGHPTSLRPPLYPFLVSGVYAVAGVENYQAVRLVQTLLNVLTAWVVYLIALELFDRRTANLAGLICVAYPSLWGHCYLLLTEVFFTFLLCLAVFFLIRFLRRDRLADLAVGAGVLGLAALTRSVMFLFPPVFVVLLLCARRFGVRRRLAAVGVFVGVFAATLSPWVVRNTLLNGGLTFVDSQGGLILRWSLDTATMNSFGGSLPRLEQATEAARDQVAMGQSVRYLLANPWLLVEHTAANFFGFWRLDRELVAGASQGLLGSVPKGVVLLMAVVVCGFYALNLLTGVAGAILVPAHDWLAALLPWLVVGHVCLVHSAVYGHSRYHIVLMPLVAVFSAALLRQARAAFSRDRLPRLALAGAVCAMFLVAWSVQVVQDDLAPLLQAVGVGS